MPTKVITRFPPSPTGALHLGGARTALFNWLFARRHGGEFVFRLEDTDRQRSRDEYVASIIDALQWLGMDYDLGPFYQSRRFERYRLVIDQLLQAGRAYWCHCTPEQLEEQRAQARAEGRKPMYSGRCRQSGLGPAPGAVVRLKCPQEGITEFNDLIKGRISVANSELDDLVVMRSDGSPTYHLAVVTDDIDMEITHVIRGDDHVSNTPRQIHIYNALNAPLPYFAHVPMILGPDKTKLSKRHGAEAVMEYQQQGFLPEAMINMLARLGWSHGDQEIFALQELIDLFDLKAVGKSPSVFDRDKLVSLNHHYIQRCAPPRLESMLAPFLAELGISAPHQPTLRACLPHIIPRGRTLAELAYWAQPYLLELPLLESAVRAKFLTPANKPILRRLLYLLETCAPGDDLEAAVTALSRELDMKLGALLPLLRAALTGRAVSPGIFEVIAVLGRQRSIARLKAALAEIN